MNAKRGGLRCCQLLQDYLPLLPECIECCLVVEAAVVEALQDAGRDGQSVLPRAHRQTDVFIIHIDNPQTADLQSVCPC